MTLPLSPPDPRERLWPGRPELTSALRAAMARADVEQERSDLRVAWIELPVGLGPRLAPFRLGEHGILWAAPPMSTSGGASLETLRWFAGWGAVEVVRTRGPERVSQAQGAMERVYNSWRDASPALPRFWGGMSFVPRGELAGCWADFGDATFVLPRLNYVDEGDGARLGVVYRRAAGDAESAVRQAEALWELVERPPAAAEDGARAEVERQESTSMTEWAAQVAAIHEGIAEGLVHKVVAARRSTLRLSPTPDPVRVFERLGALAPECHRFCFRMGARSFLGATPERLVSRRGRQVVTHALAGSIAADAEGAAERLLASSKDRAEHEYVVEALREQLGPLCQRLDVASEPGIRQLRHLLHLQTPVTGWLQDERHLLDLVERLHPTPAVGGVPTKRALEWIAELESTERGWYAAPVGWVDARGDGDMVVALRSALLLEDRAHLYAGAGIVAGSEASSEYAETEMKLAGMRAALGISERDEAHAAP